jgi:hypothetical protein
VVAIDHRSQRQAGERFSHARVAMAEDGDDLADAALEQSLRDSPDRGLAADFQEELVAIAHSLRSTGGEQDRDDPPWARRRVQVSRGH